MHHGKRIGITIGCILVVALSWIAAITMQSDEERQTQLIAEAKALLEDEIYIRAEPLLEEAITYRTSLTLTAEELLKEVYRGLAHQSGYTSKYTDLLERQMARADTGPEIYREAADYYLSSGQPQEAFAALRNGIAVTGDAALQTYYEEKRYMVKENRAMYEAVSMASGNTIAVREDGKWGIANTNGELVIPCVYDGIGTFENGCVVTIQEGVIATVDANNNRLAVYHGAANEIGGQGEGVVALQTPQGWMLTNTELNELDDRLEQVGTFSNGLAAACQDGKWGVINKSLEWVVSPDYESVAMDALGRCYMQGVLFVEKSDGFYLHNTEQELAGPYEAAQPFLDGLAAVCIDGKWGFLDTKGTVQIPCTYEEAKSYGQHLAAVKVDGRWGYISRDGSMVIEPQYLAAWNFCNGSAAVQMEDGWHFLTLVEYEEGVSI